MTCDKTNLTSETSAFHVGQLIHHSPGTALTTFITKDETLNINKHMHRESEREVFHYKVQSLHTALPCYVPKPEILLACAQLIT